MSHIIVMILFVPVVQANATELLAQNISNMQESTDQMIDKSADMLFVRGLKVGPLRNTDLDDTTFAKTRPQTSRTLNNNNRHQSQSPSPSLVPVLQDSLSIPRSLIISSAFQKGFISEGSRKDKVASKKKRSLITKISNRDLEQEMEEDLAEAESQRAVESKWFPLSFPEGPTWGQGQRQTVTGRRFR